MKVSTRWLRRDRLLRAQRRLQRRSYRRLRRSVPEVIRDLFQAVGRDYDLEAWQWGLIGVVAGCITRLPPAEYHQRWLSIRCIVRDLLVGLGAGTRAAME